MCILKTLHVSFKMPVHQNKLPSVPFLNKCSEVPVLRSTIPSRCCRRHSGRCFERVCAVTSPSSQDFANIFSLSHQSLIVQEDANKAHLANWKRAWNHRTQHSQELFPQGGWGSTHSMFTNLRNLKRHSHHTLLWPRKGSMGSVTTQL